MTFDARHKKCVFYPWSYRLGEKCEDFVQLFSGKWCVSFEHFYSCDYLFPHRLVTAAKIRLQFLTITWAHNWARLVIFKHSQWRPSPKQHILFWHECQNSIVYCLFSSSHSTAERLHRYERDKWEAHWRTKLNINLKLQVLVLPCLWFLSINLLAAVVSVPPILPHDKHLCFYSSHLSLLLPSYSRALLKLLLSVNTLRRIIRRK